LRFSTERAGTGDTVPAILPGAAGLPADGRWLWAGWPVTRAGVFRFEYRSWRCPAVGRWIPASAGVIPVPSRPTFPRKRESVGA